MYAGGPFDASSQGKVALSCGDVARLHHLPGTECDTSERNPWRIDGEVITALWLFEDGSEIVLASRSGSLQCGRISWRIEQIVTCLEGLDAVDGGKLVVAGCADGSVRAWSLDISSSRAIPLASFKEAHEGPVHAIRADPQRNHVVSVGQDGHVRFWRWRREGLVSVATLEGHSTASTDVDIDEQGKVAVSVSRDGTAVIWDVLRSKTKRTLLADDESLEAVAILPEHWLERTSQTQSKSDARETRSTKQRTQRGGKGKGHGDEPSERDVWFWTGGDRGKLQLWSTSSSTKWMEVLVEGAFEGDGILGIKLLCDKKQLVCTTTDCCVLWYQFQCGNTAGGRQPTFRLTLLHHLVGRREEILDLRFMHYKGSGEILVAAASDRAHVHVHRANDLGGVVARLAGHQHTVLCLDAAQPEDDLSWIATGSKDQELRIWTIRPMELGEYRANCVANGHGHVGAVASVAFSHLRGTSQGSCPSFVATGGADRILKVWSLDGLQASTAQENQLTSLHATASLAAHDKDIHTVAVAPNNLYVATGSLDKSIKIWRMPELALYQTLKGHRRGVWSVQFSPVDKLLASASGDRTVRLWNLLDGTCIRTLEGHTGSVLKCQFATHGTQIISAGADGLLKLWEIRNGENVQTLDEHEDKIWALCSTGDEKFLATGGGDATIKIWKDETEVEERKAREEENSRVLKEQELSNAIKHKRFQDAARIAFELNRPRNLLAVCSELLAKDNGGEQALASLIQSWNSKQIAVVLGFARDWTTNKRHCHVGQHVLHAVLQTKPPQEILKVPGIEDLLESIRPYTERHYNRVNRLIQSTFLLDMALSSMNVMEAENSKTEEDKRQFLGVEGPRLNGDTCPQKRMKQI